MRRGRSWTSASAFRSPVCNRVRWGPPRASSCSAASCAASGPSERRRRCPGRATPSSARRFSVCVSSPRACGARSSLLRAPSRRVPSRLRGHRRVGAVSDASRYEHRVAAGAGWEIVGFALARVFARGDWECPTLPGSGAGKRRDCPTKEGDVGHPPEKQDPYPETPRPERAVRMRGDRPHAAHPRSHPDFSRVGRTRDK